MKKQPNKFHTSFRNTGNYELDWSDIDESDADMDYSDVICKDLQGSTDSNDDSGQDRILPKITQ